MLAFIADLEEALRLRESGAATEVIVPMQSHFLAMQGMSKLFETIGAVREGINPDLKVSGVVLCMHEANTLLAGEVRADLDLLATGGPEQFGDGRALIGADLEHEPATGREVIGRAGHDRADVVEPVGAGEQGVGRLPTPYVVGEIG